jgi:hypothetical protein
METFESPSDKSYMEFDAAGNIVKAAELDVDSEAQEMSEKFKRPSRQTNPLGLLTRFP